MPSRFKGKILDSSSKRVAALKSAIYESTAFLDLPMALPISSDVNFFCNKEHSGIFSQDKVYFYHS
jgi:hypothetical protein